MGSKVLAWLEGVDRVGLVPNGRLFGGRAGRLHAKAGTKTNNRMQVHSNDGGLCFRNNNLELASLDGLPIIHPKTF